MRKSKIVNLLLPIALVAVTCAAIFFNLISGTGYSRSLRYIRSGDLAGLKTHLTNFPEVLRAKDAENRTLVWHASFEGEPEIVQYLIDNGADSSGVGVYGFGTAIHAASSQRHDDVLSVLIESGLNVDLTDDAGRTALFRAVERGDLLDVKLLVEKYGADHQIEINRYGLLHQSAFMGHVDVIAYLIDLGSDVNARDASGLTPLHYAASTGQTQAENVLKSAGADPALLSNDGRSVADMKNSELTQMIGAAATDMIKNQAEDK